MGDGARTEAGLVGEDAAGDAFLHAEEHTADGTARERSGVERARDDGLQHIGQTLHIEHHDAYRQHHIEQCHERHQLLRDAANALDAAQQHHGHQHGHYHAHNEVEGGQKTFYRGVVRQHGGINGRDDGVDLSGVAGAKDRQHAKQGVQHRQELPALPQAVFNIVHGAAHQLPVFVPLPEMDGQRHLRKLGAHAQQRRAPHPEHGTRPADGDGTRHARDVAGAHRRRQCGADGLERGHGAVRGILFAEHPANGGADGVGEFADLQKAGPHTEQQTHADDAHHGRDPPDKAVDRLIDGRNGFDHMFVSPVTWIFNTTEDILSYFRGGVNLFGW